MPHDASAAREAHLAVNGLSTWTATQGSGPPVVLCHGGPGSYDYLEPVAAMIDGMATVHRYDQRGCGRTESRGPWDVRTFVDDLDALRAHWVMGAGRSSATPGERCSSSSTRSVTPGVRGGSC